MSKVVKDFEIFFLYNNSDNPKTVDSILTEFNGEAINCKYLKLCHDNEGKNNRFIGLFNKTFVKDMIEQKKFGKNCDYGLVSFKNKGTKLVIPEGKTKGGFFIVINNSENIMDDKEEFIKIMESFVDAGWMYPDTYRIKNSKSESHFIILTFKKNENGNYPITFIKKLRALINGKKLKSGNIMINWLNSRYKSENKNITQLSNVEVEAN